MTDKWVDGQAVPMTPEEQAEYDAYVLSKQQELPPLKDRLKAILFALDDEVEANFVALSGGINSALDEGQVEVARIAIENAEIPAELEPVRQAMLEEFP
jgi:hypothetical protein